MNSAIVLIDAANERREAGMSTLHAAVYAARRRVVPILITSTTTIGGLFSLAVGLGGKSLMWGRWRPASSGAWAFDHPHAVRDPAHLPADDGAAAARSASGLRLLRRFRKAKDA